MSAVSTRRGSSREQDRETLCTAGSRKARGEEAREAEEWLQLLFLSRVLTAGIYLGSVRVRHTCTNAHKQPTGKDERRAHSHMFRLTHVMFIYVIISLNKLCVDLHEV